MKLCLAQTRPVKGDIPRNAAAHQRLIERAVAHGAEAIFFPELSLTGYEPTLASEKRAVRLPGYLRKSTRKRTKPPPNAVTRSCENC